MRHRVHWTMTALGSGFAVLMLPLGSHSDDFGKAYYDSRADQLVVSMMYSGTNSNHKFTLRWAPCQDESSGDLREVAGQVLDSQWQDEALRPYEETGRFGLADIPCRPAEVTLMTPPRFMYASR